VVDADERHAPQLRERARDDGARDEWAAHAGAFCVRDIVDVGGAQSRLVERLSHERQHPGLLF
jgi:hypothetical protein